MYFITKRDQFPTSENISCFPTSGNTGDFSEKNIAFPEGSNTILKKKKIFIKYLSDLNIGLHLAIYVFGKVLLL